MQDDTADSHQPTRSQRCAIQLSAYEMRLEPEDRAVFEAATGELDLTGEIRLLRTVLALLGPNLAAKVRETSTALSTLKGLIDTQAKLSDAGNDMERRLVAAAEQALGPMVGAVEDENPGSEGEEE